jgi:hypothetical protein
VAGSGDQPDAFHVIGKLTGADLAHRVDSGAIIAKHPFRAEHCPYSNQRITSALAKRGPWLGTNVEPG